MNIPYSTRRYRVVSILNQPNSAQRVHAVDIVHQTPRVFFSVPPQDFRPLIGKEVTITSQAYIVKEVHL